MTARKLIGDEITTDILKRLAFLERLIICRHCNGAGDRPFGRLGVQSCPYCHGTGDRISSLENEA